MTAKKKEHFRERSVSNVKNSNVKQTNIHFGRADVKPFLQVSYPKKKKKEEKK